MFTLLSAAFFKYMRLSLFNILILNSVTLLNIVKSFIVLLILEIIFD